MGLLSFKSKVPISDSVFSHIMLGLIVVLTVLCLGDSTLGYSTSRDSGYTAPEPTYQQPGYEASSLGYQASGEPADLTPLMIGVLVLTGLALLFPSYVNLTSVRRKRSSEGIKGKRSIFQPT